MKRLGIFLLAFILLFSSVALTACQKQTDAVPGQTHGGSNPSTVVEEAEVDRSAVAIRGGGKELSVSADALAALPQQTITSAGHELTGVTVAALFADQSLTLNDYEAIRFVSADGSNRVLTTAEMQSAPDALLALTVDGQTDPENAPAVLALPDETEADWVPAVVEITLYVDFTTLTVDTVWMYNALAANAKEEISNLEQLIYACGRYQMPAFLRILDTNGLYKWETLGIRAERIPVANMGIDGVKNTVWFAAGADAVVYPDRLNAVYSAEAGGADIRLTTLLTDLGFDQGETVAFMLCDAAGKQVPVPGGDLQYAILTPNAAGGCGVKWAADMENPPQSVEDLLYVTSTTAQIENEHIEETIPDFGGSNLGGSGGITIPDVQPSDDPVSSPDVPTAPPANLGEAGDPTKKVVLTITGDGVNRTTEWSLEELKSLGSTTTTFSIVNNWPSKKMWSAEGVLLTKLMEAAGMTNAAKTFTVTASDGYSKTFTKSQFLEDHFYYPNVASGSDSSAEKIAGMFCWSTTEQGKTADNSLRLMLGQRGINDVNTDAAVKDVIRITVGTAPASQWGSPIPSVKPGPVPAGTKVSLNFDFLDNVKIYYTTDGTNPNYNSNVYNPSTTYFQPNLIKPIVINGNTTLKVFVSGWGRNDSTVYTFSYIVQQ